MSQKYTKLTQLEHIRKRPGMYIGSADISQFEDFSILENEEIVKKNVSFSPGLYKIFDEVFQNSIDQSVKDKTLKNIKVSIDAKKGSISVFNDGVGIPVKIHEEEKIYIPELIFGHLLTSGNYNDDEKRNVAGCNGLGVKLANIFSKFFTIEVSDGKKVFKQTFSEGMTQKDAPEISKATSKKGYVIITFVPDLSFFKMKSFNDTDILKVMYSRVYLASVVVDKKINLLLNDVKTSFNMKSLSNIISDNFIYESNDNWELSAIFTDKLSGNISFVNGTHTFLGGKHVDYIYSQIYKKINDAQTKTKVSLKEIKDRLFIILKSTIVNPSFSSQSKETLSTNQKDFGYYLDLPDTFIKKVLKSGIVEDIKITQSVKEESKLKKSDGKKSSRIRVPKLEDANYAGTNKSHKCSLILTEGDSAKTFAISGLSVIGRDCYGIYPLRGKVLNVREATKKQLLENEELNNLKKIIGLQQGKEYQDVSNLRYGRIIILTDADSVTFDTPCLLKNIETGQIEIKPICEANNGNWDLEPGSGKEYSFCDKYLTWTDVGWSRIKGVMRHKVNKPIKRILTHTGCVDVTEDHSLLDILGNPITSKECKIKETQLLHSRYNQEEILENNITPEYAYALGYFQADGNCCIDGKVKQVRKDGSIYHTTNNRWTITCVDIEPLEKLKEIFEKYECSESKKTTFVISKRKVAKDSFSKESGREFKYILEAKKEIKMIAEKFRKMFYNSIREKMVPKEILNSSVEVQQSFIDGFYAGDGNKGKRTTDRFDGEYKSQMMGLFQVLQNCGYKPSLNCHSKKLNVYHILMGGKEGRGFYRPEHTVKKIIDVSEKYANTYVYDFETENHHFHGSIGNMIVKNCDGIHIQSLVVNLFATFWPSLLNIKGFLSTMKTPIVKVSKGTNIVPFYFVKDYKNWRENNNTKGWTIKYYKGLGTSTAKEAKDYFKELGSLQVDYYSTDKSQENIALAFEKKQANNRKEWILNYSQKETDESKNISYDSLINDQLIQFSIYDIQRSIPSLVDGLKPSQRKVLYTAIKTNLKKEYKVAQFAGEVAKESAYHHGEASLMGTIIGMAQNYTGSNNINLLSPIGQFGTRIASGKDHASPRYIFTKMEDITTKIFDMRDNPLLKYIDEDGSTIEPEYYVPALPMILVNGASGIGTGFSTNIPCFNPEDIIKNIIRLLEDKEPLEISPYYKGFKGSIRKVGETKYITSGVYKKNSKKISITELPIGKSIDEYKEYLDLLANEGHIKDYFNSSTEEEVDITIILNEKDDVDLKLESNINISNMYLFDDKNSIKKYNNVNDILKEYFNVRLKFYKKRKVYLLKKLAEEILYLSNKIRFLELIISDKLKVFKVHKKDLEENLKVLEFDKLENSYSYLTEMPISSFTKEKIEEYINKKSSKESDRDLIESKTIRDLWMDDLSDIKSLLNYN